MFVTQTRNDYIVNLIFRIDYAVTKKPNVSAASRINTNGGPVNATRNGTRTKRDISSSDSHEKNKYTYQPKTEGSPSLVISSENGVQTTSPTPSTTGSTVNAPRHQTRENPSFVYADVFVKREFIISNLGHFEDYNIEVHSLVDDYFLMYCSNFHILCDEYGYSSG